MASSEALSNAQHFAPVAAEYAQFRPRYPDVLFDFLAGLAPRRQLAWDCGCGSGQATRDLAERFVSVLGSDASAEQIAAATAHPHVRYRKAPAHDSGLEAGSVDLVTVAQALHWFDLDAFHAEAWRVLAPRGVLAEWSYSRIVTGNDALDACLDHFADKIVGAYWPPERVHVDNGYRDLPFPFAQIEAPAIAMAQEWTLPQLLGYLRSWSATHRYRAAHGRDPVVALAMTLLPLWGEAHATRTVRWPLTVRVGRLPD